MEGFLINLIPLRQSCGLICFRKSLCIKSEKIGRNCIFKRLYAKEILIGQYPQSMVDPMKNRKPEIFAAAKELEVLRNVKTVDSDIANENKEIDATILTKHDLVVLEGLIVRGDICSHKEVRICDDAVVCGNLFAEEDIG